MRIVGILLAAGRGSRFGGDKLLARLADGTPVGVQAARNLRAALDQVVAVVRPEDGALMQALAAAGVRVEPCASAHEGMGASLAHAVRASADADGWIIALGDMPLIRPETISRLARALEQGAAIVAPSHGGERGHPVGFAAEFGPRLTLLSGDVGARDILRAERGRIVTLEVEDPGVLADIDTPDALDRLAGG